MSLTSTPERLQKIIARSGLVSRRVAEEMIAAGRVIVDGQAAHLGQKIDPAHARIVVDGIVLPTAPDLVHYLVNKPLGTVSTAADTHDRRIVVDLVPDVPRVFPVGRLDADSTGLIVLTNDGDLTNVVTHPRYGVTKTYEALVEGVPGRKALESLVAGVPLDDGLARAISARLIDKFGGRAHLEIVMGVGRNRVVRRMCEVVGHRVVELHRAAVGPVRDRHLKAGEFRLLAIDEVRALYAAGGASSEDVQGSVEAGNE